MPDFTLELALGQATVAGLDEVGRGPLAGPVVAGAVIWPDYQAKHAFFARIRDSKKLSAKTRAELAALIKKHSLWALGQASVTEIDQLNILQASLLALQRAVAALPQAPTHLLIDGNQKLRHCALAQQTVVGGDNHSLSIAAAAIIAKVARDDIMQELHLAYPAYGWAKNAGYGSAAHMAALAAHGATPHHRTTFAPVQAVLQKAA